MEKADMAKVEQDAMNELRLQEERAQQEEEWAAKEAELDEKEAEYIRQVNVKEIDEDQFWELVVELDLERVMGKSIMKGPATTQATTQDKEIGESEQDESVEEAPEAMEKVIESSIIGRGSRRRHPQGPRGTLRWRVW
jgi:hypothetical protein